MTDTEMLRPGYAEWLGRVTATYRAVAFTCGHRLHDRELGGRVSAAVVAGLVARPAVFRYQGLPFSGRIATLAEASLAEARQGRLPEGPAWSELRAALARVPPALQDVFVLTCVDGQGAEAVATSLGCAADEARARYDAALRLMREIGDPGGSGTGKRKDSSYAVGLG